MGKSWSCTGPGGRCAASGWGGPVLHCSGQATCTLQQPPCFHSSLTILFFPSIHHSFPLFTTVRLPTVISEMTGYQNDVACAWVVGLQMVLFSSHFSPHTFQIKSYVLLLRPKWEELLTGEYWHWPLVYRMLFHLTGKSHSLASSPSKFFTTCTIQIWMSCLSYMDLGQTPFPIFEGLKSPMSDSLLSSFWCPSLSPPALPLTCESTWHPVLPLLTEEVNYLAQHTALGTTTVKIEWMSTEKRTWNSQRF